MSVALSSVCVFCGSRTGKSPAYAQAGRALGATLAQQKIRLVFGGGKVGVMGALADGALAAGGEVVGVMPHALAAREIVHTGLTRLHLVDTMHERKAMMEELCDGFIALPGGFGTFEELFEVITWSQLGIHRKPVGLLDVDGYFAPLRALVDHGVDCDFIPEAQRTQLLVATEPGELLQQMAAWTPPEPARKWIGRAQT